MPTAADLAKQVEQLDEEQWLEFLDRLDEVTQRRAARVEPSDSPVHTSRAKLANWVARAHLLLDRGVQEVWFLPTGAPDSEIRILKVSNQVLMPSAGLTPMSKALEADGVQFCLVIADVPRKGLDQIKQNPALLPPDWTLEGGIVWGRGA